MLKRAGLSLIAITMVVAVSATGAQGGGARASIASAECSSKTALALQIELHLGDATISPLLPEPEVLCGEFLGPGSQAMVATLSLYHANSPNGGWVAYRLQEGSWHLVWESSGETTLLTAHGADLEQTQHILGPHDPRCCPTGGTRSRIWRWDGTQFTAGPWIVTRPPKFGRTATLQPVSGTVLIKGPGAAGFVPLEAATSVRLGTTVDTVNGTVQLTAAANARGDQQIGRFYAGVFRVTQRKIRSRLRGGRPEGITVLSLVGELPSCGPMGARGATVSTQRKGRRLWGNAHGNFQTGGRYASATVRGTKWLTEDTCAGTLVRVARGVVSINDLPHHRTVLVRAPNSYLARPGSGG